MDAVTVILIYQGYEPFNGLLPKIKADLDRQTMKVPVIVSEQKPKGLIEKCKLYDLHIDNIKTPYILFSDVDAILPEPFAEAMLNHIKKNDLDIVFATKKGKLGNPKPCDGIFILRKDTWLEFRKEKIFEKFLTAKGIPTFLPMFILWCCNTKKVGFEFECQVRLRLPGIIARNIQNHPETRRQTKKLWMELKANPVWKKGYPLESVVNC